jgi:hypothetical protein
LSQGSMYVLSLVSFEGGPPCMGCWIFLVPNVFLNMFPIRSSLSPISFGLSFTLVTYIQSPKNI